MVSNLLKNNHAYENEKHVYFSVSSFKKYGRLSNKNSEELVAGSRVEISEYKKEIEEGTNPRDIKFELAMEIVTRFHNIEFAKLARDDFVKRFSNNLMPENIDDFEIIQSTIKQLGCQ